MAYLKNQFKLQNFGLSHHKITDFYLSCFQKGQSVLPLLLIRIFIFLSCLTTVLISLVVPPLTGSSLHYWPIYMTNWGVVFINITSGFAVVVSWAAYYKVPYDTSLKLPWYIKTYWALLTITVSLAVFITSFFYIMLFDNEVLTIESPVYLAQDFLAHAVNSILMLLLLFTSRTPFRIVHFYFPVGIGFVYMIFSAIYYVAGGINSNGDRYIYAVLDWSVPGPTLILALICIPVVIVIHLLIASLTALRDVFTRSCTNDDDSSYFM